MNTEHNGRMRAAGMYGLLAEVLACGALRDGYGDLAERIQMAVQDQEEAMGADGATAALPDCGEAGHAEGRCGNAQCLRGNAGVEASDRGVIE